MATQQPESSVKPAFLFIPDISGFTKFVSETEIIHSQHIVQELLEILIDSNLLNLQISEIEGDAIFFYRPGNKPGQQEILKQVETMYFNFHRHLKLYDHQRICNCGACKSAVDLKLKIVAHYGEVSEYMVKDHKKLFGKDVILIHRLLKNNIDSNEYILMTDPLIKDDDHVADISWFSATTGKENYDAGEVDFTFSVLSELYKIVPPPQLPHFNLSAKASVNFTLEEVVPAEMEKVFGTIFDLELRPTWMEGIKGIEMLNHEKINRTGTNHRCIVSSKNNPIIVTESATTSSDKMELVEMDQKGMGGCRFSLQRLTPEETNVKVEMLVRNNPVVKLMFGLMMKKKYKKQMTKSLSNLKQTFSPAPAS